jgi:hypothetical protein
MPNLDKNRTENGRSDRGTLYDLLFQTRGLQYAVYLLAFVISLGYACVADLVFLRPMDAVVLEGALLLACLLVVLPFATLKVLPLVYEKLWVSENLCAVRVLLPNEVKKRYEAIASNEFVTLSQVLSRVAIEFVDLETEASRSRREIIIRRLLDELTEELQREKLPTRKRA